MSFWEGINTEAVRQVLSCIALLEFALLPALAVAANMGAEWALAALVAGCRHYALD